MERKDTRIHLVEELQKLKATPEIQEMIREAQAGEYHDYKNQKYDCGKVEVVNKLWIAAESDVEQRRDLLKIREQVMEGNFDEEADEEDKENLRKLLPRQAWDQFGL